MAVDVIENPKAKAWNKWAAEKGDPQLDEKNYRLKAKRGKVIPCMTCRNDFKSAGPHNRICAWCKNNHDFYDPSASASIDLGRFR